MAEVKSHAGDSNWAHAESVDSLADILTNTFTLSGNCRFPLYINGSMAKERLSRGSSSTSKEWPVTAGRFLIPPRSRPLFDHPFKSSVPSYKEIIPELVADTSARALPPLTLSLENGRMRRNPRNRRMTTISHWRYRGASQLAGPFLSASCMRGSSFDCPICQTFWGPFGHGIQQDAANGPGFGGV